MLIKIPLNGFVKRTQHSDVLKLHIKSTGALLSRKGRSKNWNLQASGEQLQKIIKLISHADEDSWLWLIKKLEESKPQLSLAQLKNIAMKDPTITVTQLKAMTDCTLADARKVLDELEWE